MAILDTDGTVMRHPEHSLSIVGDRRSETRELVESLSAPLHEALREIAESDRDGSEADRYKARARGRLRALELVYNTRPPAIMWHLDPRCADEICQIFRITRDY